MANNLVSMQHVRSSIQQLQKGFSQRRIARELQLSRNTIKQYAGQLLDSHYSLQQLQQVDDATLASIIYSHSRQWQPDARREDFKGRVKYLQQSLSALALHGSYCGKNTNALILMAMSTHNLANCCPALKK